MNGALVWMTIAGMAIASYATRVAGLLLLRNVEVRGRLKTALDALPVAILTAVIAPTVLSTGLAETLAALVTLCAAAFRLPLVAVIAAGVVSVVALRHLIG